MGRQQRLDPVLDADPFLNQMFALTMLALCVFLVRRRYADHAADVVLSSPVTGQHPQQALRVEPIGLCPPGAPADQDACGLHHVIGHAMRHKKTMQPKPVAASFETARHSHFVTTKLRPKDSMRNNRI